MKSIILSFLLVLGVISISTAQFGVGLGITTGTNTAIDNLDGYKVGVGLQLKGHYVLSSKFELSPDFQYFFQTKGRDDLGYQVKGDYMDANLNIQFNTINNDYNRGYFYVGPTFGWNTVSGNAYVNGEFAGIIDFNYNAIGFNVGYGIEQAIGIYTDIKYQHKFFLSSNFDDLEPEHNNFSQVVLTLGYLLRIDKQPTEVVEEM